MFRPGVYRCVYAFTADASTCTHDHPSFPPAADLLGIHNDDRVCTHTYISRLEKGQSAVIAHLLPPTFSDTLSADIGTISDVWMFSGLDYILGRGYLQNIVLGRLELVKI